MEIIPDDSICQINKEIFYLERLPIMSTCELFDRINQIFPDECKSATMLRRLMCEAYRRLDEADALRKENAELKAKLEAATEAYTDLDIEKVERYSFFTITDEPVCLSSDVAELELQFDNAKRQIAELREACKSADSAMNDTLFEDGNFTIRKATYDNKEAVIIALTRLTAALAHTAPKSDRMEVPNA